MTLIECANKNEMPDVQLMDIDTLKWIETNGYEYLKTKNYASLSSIFLQHGIKYFRTPQEWYLTSHLYQSIHGTRHHIRTSIYGFFLCKMLSIDRETTDCLSVAIALHDLHRLNDKRDFGHGERANLWFSKNIAKVEDEFKITLSKNRINDILIAIKYHETPYESVPKQIRNNAILNLIKTADALDRFRLPNKEWWLNIDYLSIIPTSELIKFSLELLLQTEKKYIANKTIVNYKTLVERVLL